MLNRFVVQGIYQQDKAYENIYAKHFPEKLCEFLDAMGLIKEKQKTFELDSKNLVKFSINEEKVENNLVPNAVSISIFKTVPINKPNSSNLMLLDVLESNTKSIETIYYFINQNALFSIHYDENGFSHKSAYNKKALHIRENFSCEKETQEFVSKIVATIKEVDLEMQSYKLASSECCIS